MTGKGEQEWSKLSHKSTVGMVFLAALLLPILIVCTEEGEATELQMVSQQQGLRASKIIDAVVKNNRGDEVGEVDNLIINQEGKVEKIILAVGGFKFMGMGEKLVPLPFKPLKIIDLGIIYNIATQQLNNLPEFSLGKNRQS